MQVLLKLYASQWLLKFFLCACVSACVFVCVHEYVCVCVCVCVSRPGSRTDVYLPRSLLEKEEATPPTPGSPAPPVRAPAR